MRSTTVCCWRALYWPYWPQPLSEEIEASARTSQLTNPGACQAGRQAGQRQQATRLEHRSHRTKYSNNERCVWLPQPHRDTDRHGVTLPSRDPHTQSRNVERLFSQGLFCTSASIPMPIPVSCPGLPLRLESHHRPLPCIIRQHPATTTTTIAVTHTHTHTNTEKRQCVPGNVPGDTLPPQGGRVISG